MSAANSALVELFCARAAMVGAKIHEAATMDAAIAYVVDVCTQKAPCELLAEEAGAEKGALSDNRVPTRTERIVAAPGIDAAVYDKLAQACADKGFVCMDSGLRTRLAGIDVGLSMALRGVAASGTCMVNVNSEDVRLASMICEINVIVLRKSDIRPDLGAIAGDVRAQQTTGTPSYTAFVTGPSRTADIERVPAVGVHGPLELHIILLEG